MSITSGGSVASATVSGSATAGGGGPGGGVPAAAAAAAEGGGPLDEGTPQKYFYLTGGGDAGVETPIVSPVHDRGDSNGETPTSVPGAGCGLFHTVVKKAPMKIVHWRRTNGSALSGAAEQKPPTFGVGGGDGDDSSGDDYDVDFDFTDPESGDEANASVISSRADAYAAVNVARKARVDAEAAINVAKLKAAFMEQASKASEAAKKQASKTAAAAAKGLVSKKEQKAAKKAAAKNAAAEAAAEKKGKKAAEAAAKTGKKAAAAAAQENKALHARIKVLEKENAKVQNARCEEMQKHRQFIGAERHIKSLEEQLAGAHKLKDSAFGKLP